MVVDVTPVMFFFWLIAGATAGAMCGIVPLVMALYRQRKMQAWAVMSACVMAGLVYGFWTAVPVMLGCVYIVRRKDSTCTVLKKGFLQADGSYKPHPDPSRFDQFGQTLDEKDRRG